MRPTDFTHDPARRSWVVSAQGEEGDFPLQNLPHGVFRRRGRGEAWRGGVAIGDAILDLAALHARGAWPKDMDPPARRAAEAAAAPSLNGLMALGITAWRALRAVLSRELGEGAERVSDWAACLVPQAEAEMALPARPGHYTDFFTSPAHMLNMGRLFQPDRPVLPQFHWLPIAYHARASTVEVSGAELHRPCGLFRPPGATEPVFGPTRALDYELEIGAWLGPGNRRGEPIGINEAEDRLFGLCLLNDWSARDLQGYEAMPLGPFLSKNFLTSVSPWIVTLEALRPFRCAVSRPADLPVPPAHLSPSSGLASAGIDLVVEAALETAARPGLPQRLSLSSTRHAAWGFAQMLAHHTSNGCAVQAGDLLGSGTQSGPGPGEQGCLMELTEGGRLPLALAGDEQRRSLLEDGDTVVLKAWARRPGAVGLGFGECRGTVLAARPAPSGPT